MFLWSFLKIPDSNFAGRLINFFTNLKNRFFLVHPIIEMRELLILEALCIELSF